MSAALPTLDCRRDPGTAARSRLYRLLSFAVGFPDQALRDAVADGTLRAALADASGALPYALAIPPEALAGADVGNLETDYIRLFDVGPAGPPCPLYGGVYQGDRMYTMEEVTRFYNFFGLRLSPALRELPDHLTTELEFMHYLTFRESELRQREGDPSPFLRAERDFLTRHLCRWLPRLAERLGRETADPFFPALFGFCLAFVTADRRYAEAASDAAET